MITTYERGKIEGKIEGGREAALLQLDAKFGPLAAGVTKRVEALSPRTPASALGGPRQSAIAEGVVPGGLTLTWIPAKKLASIATPLAQRFYAGGVRRTIISVNAGY
jgi:hypothetical protein